MNKRLVKLVGIAGLGLGLLKGVYAEPPVAIDIRDTFDQYFGLVLDEGLDEPRYVVHPALEGAKRLVRGIERYDSFATLRKAREIEEERARLRIFEEQREIMEIVRDMGEGIQRAEEEIIRGLRELDELQNPMKRWIREENERADPNIR